MDSIIFGEAKISKELACGFIPPNIIEELDSENPDDHINAAQELVSMVEKIPFDMINVPEFIVFSQPYFLDENFSVINSFNEIIEILIPQCGHGALSFLEEFLTMTITPMSDQRRAVRILTINLLLLYIQTTQSLDLLVALMPLFTDQPSRARTEILDFATQSIQRITPTAALYRNFAELLIDAFKYPEIAVQTSAARLLNQLFTINHEFVNMLPENILSYLSEDDQNKMIKVASIKPKPPMSRPVLPNLSFKPKQITNPRAGKMIIRPKIGQNSVRAHSQKPIPNLPIIEQKNEQVPQNPIEDLRDRYKCQSQPKVHPPEPRPMEPSPRSKSPHAPRPRSLVTPPKYSNQFDLLLNDLQSESWEVQNDAIIAIIEMVDSNPKMISSNLRVIVFSLMNSVSSQKIALAESALTCLCEICSEFGEDMTSFYDTILNHMLVLLTSKRCSISRLAADTISAILVNIDRDSAIEFLSKDHSKQDPLVKEHLSLCIDALCGDCKDPIRLLPTIANFLQEPITKDHAKASLFQLYQTEPSLNQTDVYKKLNGEDKNAIDNALSDPLNA